MPEADDLRAEIARLHALLEEVLDADPGQHVLGTDLTERIRQELRGERRG